jgi:hypothetical protein
VEALLGVFVLIHLWRYFTGDESPEHQAARAMADVVHAQAQANTANAADAIKAAAQASPAAIPAPAAAPHVAPAPAPAPLPVALAPTATAPTGAPVVMPQIPTPTGPASPAASPTPFPAALPANLPPFPANWGGGQPPGWVYSTPVLPAVSARAQALLPQLWATGVGTHTTEMTGGVWTTYNAEWSNAAKTMKGVTAYKPKVAV